MRRGRALWFISVAVGSLALTPQTYAGEKPGPMRSDIRQAADTIASAIHDTSRPAAQDQGCVRGSDQRRSDLCAEWKSADAAKDAANYALWTLIVSALGTGLLIWTLAETRATTRRELRAYVSVRSGGLVIQETAEKGTLISFEVISHNGGATPAYECDHLATLAIMTRQHAALELKSVKPIDKDAYSGGVVVHSGDDFVTEMPNRILVPPDLLDAIKKGTVSLYMFGVSSYLDTFGIRRRTDFCQFIDGDRFADAFDKAAASPGDAIVTKWTTAPFHNAAT